MIILGIDPGTATTGYGVIKKTNRKKHSKAYFSGAKNSKVQKGLECVSYGVIKTDPESPDTERLRRLHNQLNQIIRKYKPEFVVVEKLYFFKNLKTAIPVAQARGVILLAAAKKEIPVFEFTPLQVKTTVTGYGRSEKKQIQEMIKFLLDLKEIPKPDDAADALGVAICCANLLGNTVENDER